MKKLLKKASLAWRFSKRYPSTALGIAWQFVKKWVLGPLLIFAASFGVARWFLKGIIPANVIFWAAIIFTIYAAHALLVEDNTRLRHQAWIKDTIPFSKKIIGFMSPSGVIFLLIALGMLIASLTVANHVVGWFLPKFLTDMIAYSLWAWGFFIYTLPWLLVYVEPNTTALYNYDFLKSKTKEGLDTQREVNAGFSPVIQLIESEVDQPISLKWFQILVPSDVRFQTKDKVEIRLLEAYHRIRIPSGKVKTANLHGLDEIKQAFRTRMVGWLTKEIKKHNANELGNVLKTLEADFLANFGEGRDPDKLEEKYGGIECDELRIGDVELPKAVEAANAAGAVMAPIVDQVDSLVAKTNGRLTWEQAWVWTSVTMGNLSSDFAFLLGMQGMFGGNRNNNQNQQNRGQRNQRGNNNPQQGQP